MVSKAELIVAVEDLYCAVAESFGIYDGTSNPKLPEAPAEHYDKLARAIITYAKVEPDTEQAVRTLRFLLPCIEKASLYRANDLETDELRKDPVCDAWYKAQFLADHGRLPRASALEDTREFWCALLVRNRADRQR